jgi:hypothetical protein
MSVVKEGKLQLMEDAGIADLLTRATAANAVLTKQIAEAAAMQTLHDSRTMRIQAAVRAFGGAVKALDAVKGSSEYIKWSATQAGVNSINIDLTEPKRMNRAYGWIGQQSGSGFSDLAPSTLHYNMF